MKLSTTKVIIILTLIVLIGFSYAIFRKINPQPAGDKAADKDTPVNTYEVKAENGRFTPDFFRTEVLTDMELQVTAVDRDYEFKVDGYPRLDSTVGKGETKVIRISALGEGDYKFSCGGGCSGTIRVSNTSDTKDNED